jgi:hypothetical protein
MATWTANAASGIRPYRSAHGAPIIRYFTPTTAASTATCIKTGDIVQFDTAVATAAHRVALAQSTGGNGANLLSILADKLLGIAMEPDLSDGSTLGMATRNKIGVALITPTQEFIGYTRWAGPVTSTFIGQTRSVIRDSTLRIWQVDSTNSTAALQTVVITEVPEEYEGSTGGQVVFKFLSSLAHPVAQ